MYPRLMVCQKSDSFHHWDVFYSRPLFSAFGLGGNFALGVVVAFGGGGPSFLMDLVGSFALYDKLSG